MQVLALDIGQKRIGIAQGNTNTQVSTPVKVLPAYEVISNVRSWKTLLEDYEPQLLVFGLPRSMNGSSGKQAQVIKKQAATIAQNACLPYEFIDERLSSSEAKSIMHRQGMKEKDMRGKVDMIAASLFLQTWLDVHNDKE